MAAHSLPGVVDAQAATNVEKLEVEALVADLLDEVNHQQRSIPENVDLQRIRMETDP